MQFVDGIELRQMIQAALLLRARMHEWSNRRLRNLGLLLLDLPGAAPQEKERARELLAKACAPGSARACGKVR
jgi:hypothetical protein